MAKAPLGGNTGPNPTDRGKSGVKRSLLTEGHGVPIGLAVDRPAPTEDQPQGMCLDKGYDYDEVREFLRAFGFTAHIRSRGEEAKALQREAGSEPDGGWWSGHTRG